MLVAYRSVLLVPMIGSKWKAQDSAVALQALQLSVSSCGDRQICAGMEDRQLRFLLVQ